MLHWFPEGPLDSRKHKLLTSVHEATSQVKRFYHGSLESQLLWTWNVVRDTPKTETGEPLVSPRLPLPKILFEFAFRPLIDQYAPGHYTWTKFWNDLAASISQAFLLLPGGIAYSLLAGLPSISGLTSCIIPLMVYFLFGTSRQLSVGPEALTSIITGVVIEREMAHYPGGNPVQIAATLAMLTGLFCLVLSALRAGFIDNIISGYLLTGFVTGIALLIMSEQLPSLLGIPIKVSGEFPTYEKLGMTLTNLNKIHWPTFAVGVTSLILLICLKSGLNWLVERNHRWAHRIPSIAILMILSIIVSASAKLESFGIPVLGSFENHLVAPFAPVVTFELIKRYSADIVMLTLVGYIEIQSVTRHYSLLNGYNSSGDRELFAIGAANVVGSCFGAYSVFGSLPRSRILASSGAVSTLAGLLSSVWVLIALYSLNTILYYIPKAVLAAIIFKAAAALIEFKEIAFIFKIHAWADLIFFLLTLTLTFMTAITNGIIFCLILALLIIVKKVSTADLSILGRVETPNSLNTNPIFLDIKEHPDCEVSDGVMILAVRGPLLFYNCGELPRTMDMLIKADKQLLEEQSEEQKDLEMAASSLHSEDQEPYYPPDESTAELEPQTPVLSLERLRFSTLSTRGSFDPRFHVYVIIFDFTRCNDLDASALLVLEQVIHSYKSHHTRFIVTGLHPFHVKLFRKSGLMDKLGEENVFKTVQEAMNSISKFRV